MKTFSAPYIAITMRLWVDGFKYIFGNSLLIKLSIRKIWITVC